MMAPAFQNNTVKEFTCTSENTYNMSLSETERFYVYPKGHTFIVTIAFSVILSVGILLNIAFIYVVVRIKSMRTVTNKYLINLAIADIVFLTAAISEKLWRYSKSPVMGDHSPLGSTGCIGVYFLIDVTYFASLTFITIVSLDRYFALCRPMDLDNPFKWNVNKIIVVTWIFAIVLGLILIPAYSNFNQYCVSWPNLEPFSHWPNAIAYCDAINAGFRDFVLLFQTIPFFVTFSLNLYIYVSIVRALNRWVSSQDNLRSASTSHGHDNDADRVRHQMAKMIIFNGVTFFILLAPFELVSLIQLIGSLRGSDSGFIFVIVNSRLTLHVSRILSYVNSAVNPLVYTIMCPAYLSAFKEALLPTFRR